MQKAKTLTTTRNNIFRSNWLGRKIYSGRRYVLWLHYRKRNLQRQNKSLFQFQTSRLSEKLRFGKDLTRGLRGLAPDVRKKVWYQMGRLVLTRFNKRTCKVEQLTLENVNLSAHYIDNFGRPTTLIHLIADNPACVQKSYIITEVTDERLVEGIHYNASEAAQKWWDKYEKQEE